MSKPISKHLTTDNSHHIYDTTYRKLSSRAQCHYKLQICLLVSTMNVHKKLKYILTWDEFLEAPPPCIKRGNQNLIKFHKGLWYISYNRNGWTNVNKAPLMNSTLCSLYNAHWTWFGIQILWDKGKKKKKTFHLLDNYN